MTFPEMKMNVFDIISHYGYPAEQYDVTTEDGYILTIHRIPYGKSGPGSKPRQPVIIQHGFLCSSVIWVFNTPSDSLGFILADAGYDVWLTNIRGNMYGRRHTTMNPQKESFWKFSFDEMGRYDMPAIIDFVLSKTRFSQTNYIGHSMGTTLAFVMLATKPEYNKKVRSLIAMAPVISVQHMTSALTILKPFRKDLSFLIKFVGGYEFLPNGSLNKYFVNIFSNYSLIKKLYSFILDMTGGSNSTELNLSRLPVYSSHIPAGTSVQTCIHSLQLTEPGFRRFDHGSSVNMIKYGQLTPPLYDMKNVTAPVAVFWSENDTLADPTDVAMLVSQVPNLVVNFKVPYSKFTHMDFFWAINAKTLIYNPILQVLKNVKT